ncbi:PREDICTED: immunoglobulin superfamily containing leucine-rich repeat protein 2-like [Branchiostoma belcheri]|uniref:Immunoglobulin superfamily containing leucine-rich repeat protein 2-like n=1 Tax=Branchiostoma belcheri TaxID=7741 RepID=A0A6P4XY85_BRABE|nr:PREDICTED: immunoglobulin superfamily containing leucine-rich repeat protein 2-like [Branchiostoma belcheri]
MAVSGLLMLLVLGSLWTGCSCLPDRCRIQRRSYFGTLSLWVDCDHLNLATLPDGIPSNTERFCAEYNNIRNVSYMPSLPGLLWLDLGTNAIESFAWTSLRNLPNLRFLYLNINRLRYVQLGNVIEHLPKLKHVDLSYNKITSISRYELGRPQVKKAYIMDNPFHCDCYLFWLIEKMACLTACKGEDEKACCLSCSACFLAGILKYKAFRMTCHSPNGLKNLPLSDVFSHLTGCWPHQPTTEAHDYSPNILLSAMAGTLSSLTLMILCHHLYERKCYGYVHVH